MSYLLKLFQDDMRPNSEAAPGIESQHAIIYVYEGLAYVNGKEVEKDAAVYAEDFATIKAGSLGATLWRWELVPESDPVHLLMGNGINSILRLSRKIKMFELVPTSKWLFRLDSIVNHQGATGLHAHPGSGIRCMIEGQMRVVSEKGESSDNRTGDAWYEEGAYPVASASDPGNHATFLRGMVLPPEFYKHRDTFIRIEEENTVDMRKAGMPNSGWKSYFQKIITLR